MVYLKGTVFLQFSPPYLDNQKGFWVFPGVHLEMLAAHVLGVPQNRCFGRCPQRVWKLFVQWFRGTCSVYGGVWRVSSAYLGRV